MDGLSGAASGMAVVSLSIQLAAGIKKLCEFWGSIQDAPDDILAIVKDLRVLSAVLDGMRWNEQRYGPDHTSTSVLENCTDKVATLLGLVNDLEPGFASTSRRVRKWNAFKATLRREQIKKFRVSLGETKVTLMLAQQIPSDCVTGVDFDRIDSQQRNLLEITQGIAGIQMQQYSRTVTTLASGFAAVNAHLDDLRAEIRRTSSIVTNPILHSGFEIGMSNAYEGLNKSHWLAQQTVIREESLPIREECDEDTEQCVSPVLRKSRTTISTTRRRNQRRACVRYQVSEHHSSTENMLGNVSFTTKTFHLRSQYPTDLDTCRSEDVYEFKTAFTIHPAPWLINWGLNFGLRFAIARSTQGWKQKLETYCAVPDDSLIFEYCKKGNLDGVRLLLSSGMASPHDTDSTGWTPLHFAAECCCSQLCMLLIDSGADPNVHGYRDDWSSPLHCMVASLILVKSQDFTATVSLFSDNVGFSEEDGNGWYLLKRLCCETLADTMVWAFTYFLPEIQQSSFRHQAVILLQTLSYQRDPASTRAVKTILALDCNMVNATLTLNGQSALHNTLSVTGDESMTRVLMTRGANLHLTSYNNTWLEPGENPAQTPTSVAMRQSHRFFEWRKLLIELGYDLEGFVMQELQQSPLVLAGWDKDTLLALFAYEFQPCVLRGKDRCTKCNSYIQDWRIREFWWEQNLQKLKARVDLNAESEPSEAILWEGERSCRRCHGPEENLYHSQGESFCRYCHEPGGDAFHEPGKRSCIWHHQPGDTSCHKEMFRSRWSKGRRCCHSCEWKLHYLRRSLVLDEDWDSEDFIEDLSEESFEDDYSPLHIHF